MSGLLALLDDVAAIAKVSAASVDDIAAAAAKAGTKAAGIIIDDAAVTPKYVTGFAAARELPIIWRIARGSLFNKLVILLPIALLLNSFAPWIITPILMLGGVYLCYEGAEKIVHVLMPHNSHASVEHETGDPVQLEEKRIAGAIKTDFILSAEIMTIALNEIAGGPLWQEAAALAVVAIGITFLVYGVVAIIVKMDDVGLFMATNGRLGSTRLVGRGLVKGMPILLKVLSTVGTVAMLWVGGSILVHGLEVLGWPWLYHEIDAVASSAASGAGEFAGIVGWAVKAALDGVFGLLIGLLAIPVVAKVVLPAYRALRG